MSSDPIPALDASQSDPMPGRIPDPSGDASQSSAPSPCAACKFLRRKCQKSCVFAPYFPAENLKKFLDVHRIFGASNVSKILCSVQPCLRETAVDTLVYEAACRISDPIYGCVRQIHILKDELHKLESDLYHLSCLRDELSRYLAALKLKSSSRGKAAGDSDMSHFNLKHDHAFPVAFPAAANADMSYFNLKHSTELEYNPAFPVALPTDNELQRQQIYDSDCAAQFRTDNDSDLAALLRTDDEVNGAEYNAVSEFNRMVLAEYKEEYEFNQMAAAGRIMPLPLPLDSRRSGIKPSRHKVFSSTIFTVSIYIW